MLDALARHAAVRRVLVVVPEAGLRSDLVQALRAAGWSSDEARSLDSLPSREVGASHAAALIDVPDPSALGGLARLRRLAPGLPIVAIGANPSIELAVGAVREGALDFLRMPFDVASLESALARVGTPDPSGSTAPVLLTEDPVTEKVIRQTRAAASTEATVRIVGESGTGKELLSRLLHHHSRRRGGPFVVVGCAGLPEALAESELFGHEKGAFTGAVEARTGQLATADGGTLVLDEVSDLSARLQPKLLRVLQDGEVAPLGSSVRRRVDLRLVATTQRDLAAEVREGRFRADLFYRLDVITLRMPPLRERPADVQLLARHFLARFAEANGVEPPHLSQRAIASLQRHPFRGNVRELQNLMRRAAVIFPGRDVEVGALLSKRGGARPRRALPIGSLNLRELEQQAIVHCLAETGGNRTRAAEVLGISVRTLRNKIRLYGLQ